MNPLLQHFWKIFACAALAVGWLSFNTWVAAWSKQNQHGETVHVKYKDETEAGSLVLKSGTDSKQRLIFVIHEKLRLAEQSGDPDAAEFYRAELAKLETR